MEMTPEIQVIEDKFKKILKTFLQIVSYHDFRVVAGTQGRVNLETLVKKEIQNVLYCSFYITPKFSY